MSQDWKNKAIKPSICTYECTRELKPQAVKQLVGTEKKQLVQVKIDLQEIKA